MFNSKLVVEESDNSFWVLTEELVYEGKTDLFKVPEGFSTDFASVPRMFWGIVPPYGQHTKAAVVHDYLYTFQPVSKEDADGIFNRIMRELGVSAWRRNIMYWSVRLFGQSAWKAGEQEYER